CHTTRIAVLRCIPTRSITLQAKRSWSRLMLRRERRSGPPPSPTTNPAITSRWPPLAASGKIMVGASGGEFGIRGFVSGYDADTGKELWRTFTIPARGEPGSETWPKGDQWKTGGAPVWVTGNYDPDTNLAYWGTGNGGPWIGDQRPGDNLYTASTIAIDVAT